MKCRQSSIPLNITSTHRPYNCFATRLSPNDLPGLPAPAECPVQIDYCGQFIFFQRCQLKFTLQRIALCGDHFEVGSHTISKQQVCVTDSLLQSADPLYCNQFLLPYFLCLYQRV